MTEEQQRYGGPWQELRALLATALINWALSVHPQAALDMVTDLAARRLWQENAPQVQSDIEQGYGSPQ